MTYGVHWIQSKTITNKWNELCLSWKMNPYKLRDLSRILGKKIESGMCGVGDVQAKHQKRANGVG